MTDVSEVVGESKSAVDTAEPDSRPTEQQDWIDGHSKRTTTANILLVQEGSGRCEQIDASPNC